MERAWVNGLLIGGLDDDVGMADAKAGGQRQADIAAGSNRLAPVQPGMGATAEVLDAKPAAREFLQAELVAGNVFVKHDQPSDIAWGPRPISRGPAACSNCRF